MKIYLIIQRTFNGLKTDYKSENLNLSNSEIENIFGDEQSASQLASASIIYTVENLEKFRVYSFINNTVSDNAGRAGYYAIRLLVPSGKILVNVRGIFNEIAKRYEQYFEQKRLAEQDYSKLLAAVFEKNCVLDKSILVGSKKDAVFYSKYEADERVDDTMNEDSTYLIKKLYLFAKDQSKTDEIIRQSGFKSFAALSDSIKKIKIINTDNYLQVLKINDNEVSLPQGNFEIFVFDSDRITYRDKNRDNKKDKDHRGKTLEVRRPIPVNVPPVDPYPNSNQNPGFGLGPLLATSLVTLMVGCVIGWGLKTYVFPPKKEIFEQGEVIPQSSEPYYLSLDPAIKDFTLLGNNISEIASYKFKYSDKDKKWTYSDGNATFKNLDSMALSEIGKKSSLNEEEFKNALEKISGKTIDFSKVKETSGIPSPTENSPLKVESRETPVTQKQNQGSNSQTNPADQANSPSNNTSGTTTKEKTIDEIAKEKKRQAEISKAKATTENINKSGQNSGKTNKLDKGSTVRVE